MTPRLALLVAGFGGLLVTGLLGFLFVPLLRKLHYIQPIRNSGPSWHASKSGTPTMGGLMLILGSLAALLVPYFMLTSEIPEMTAGNWQEAGKAMSIAVGFAVINGLIGFVDDCVKVWKQRNKGLSVRAKLLLQLIVVVGFLLVLQQNGIFTTWVQLPGVGLVDLGIAFYPLSYLLMLGIINGANLTDGVDGLASSVTFLIAAGFLVICSLLGWFDLGLFGAALAGACAGFLLWNFHPAKIFMGDTGSLFLGGAVVGIAYAMGHPELLLLLGLVYLVEAASVLLQVTWFRITKGKRLFKMAPLHHHFELSGWSEVKITAWFSGVTLACVAIAFTFAYLTY